MCVNLLLLLCQSRRPIQLKFPPIIILIVRVFFISTQLLLFLLFSSHVIHITEARGLGELNLHGETHFYLLRIVLLQARANLDIVGLVKRMEIAMTPIDYELTCNAFEESYPSTQFSR